MKAKDKAKELVDKFINATDYNGYGQQCALIAVDEILKNNKILFEDSLNDIYWQQVKQEIEKL
jgi:hypothetical protein